MPDPEPPPLDPHADLETSQLLSMWHQGDREALDALFRKHRDWIQRRVRRRLGADLRARLESTDILQETFLRFLKHGPRLHVENERTFRALMAVITENAIRDTHNWFTRRRRDMAREQILPEDSIVYLDVRRDRPDAPDEIVSRAEHQAIVRVALELLKPADREVLMLRNRDRLSFAAIGERLGIQESAADTRFRRASTRLLKVTDRIRARDVESLLDEFLSESEE